MERFRWPPRKKKARFVVNVINHMYSCDVAENTRLREREKGPSGLWKPLKERKKGGQKWKECLRINQRRTHSLNLFAPCSLPFDSFPQADKCTLSGFVRTCLLLFHSLSYCDTNGRGHYGCVSGRKKDETGEIKSLRREGERVGCG